MLSDGEDDFLHHHLLCLCPDVIVVDFLCKLRQFRARQKMLLRGQADRRVLGRHKEPCRKENIGPGPAEHVQNIPVGPLFRIPLADLSHHFKKGAVILLRIEVVDDQKQAASIAGDPGEMEGKQVLRRNLLPAKPVLKTDSGDGAHKVFVKRYIDAASVRRPGGILQGKRSLAAAAVSGDPDRAFPVPELFADPLQFSAPALEDPPGPGRLRDRCNGGKPAHPRLPLLHLQNLYILRQKTAETAAAVAQKGRQDQPGQSPSQCLVRALLLSAGNGCVKGIQKRTDITINRVPVRCLHLRNKFLLLLRRIAQKSFNLIAEIFFAFPAVDPAVFLHDQRVGLQNAAHGGRRPDLSLLRVAVYQHPVKLCSPGRNGISLLFTAQQKTAPLCVRLNIVHQSVPAAEMQEEEMVHLNIGTAVFCQDLRHIGQALLGKPLVRVIPCRHGKIRGRKPHQGTALVLGVQPAVDRLQRENIITAHTFCFIPLSLLPDWPYSKGAADGA